MKNELSSEQWAGERGNKWCSKLAGMEAMLAPLNAPLIDALKLDKSYRIAEVGCGGGGTAVEIHSAAPEGSTVHGYDINSDLIEAARGRISAGNESIAFEVADMESTLPLARPYDRLVSRFGTLFFSDEHAGFTNLAKWLAPGGRFAFAVWGPAAENPWITTGREVVSSIIDLPQPEPDSPGPF
nr:class I SAM-dependent methyltransferase [Phycisphaerae bacterium]NIU11119.1 class I SAM-dependent methyltransferase [Phycisphaerae bacterium]NIW41702.1 methyltransferase domain-containing protein [candidate division Zixibacteria bacterium]NIX01209.1 methyltransferase domain-containing protein [Phycisphaerae bacterium]